MRYQGGKLRVSKKIAELVNSYSPSVYYEPFVGGNTIARLIHAEEKYLSDSNQALITMWLELSAGWVPPEHVSEEQYYALKEKNDPNDPLTAFVGFGCSFAGKFWAGYARSGSRSYAAESARLCEKKLNGLNAQWSCRDYSEIDPKPGSVVYCDPPYAGTMPYRGQSFCNDEFWLWAEKVSKRSVVLVSEYSAPENWSCIAEFKKRHATSLTNRDIRTERIFQLSGS